MTFYRRHLFCSSSPFKTLSLANRWYCNVLGHLLLQTGNVNRDIFNRKSEQCFSLLKPKLENTFYEETVLISPVNGNILPTE